MNSYINNLVNQGEHQRLDFKFEISDSKKIAKTLSAFSNTDGGKLLVGIKDNGAIAGVRSDEEFYMIEGAAQLYCKPEISFTVKEWKVNKRIVLEIDIKKDISNRPIKAKNEDGRWLTYIRIDDQNLLANTVLLKVWEKQKRKSGIVIKFTEKEKLLLQYLYNNDMITLSKFKKIAFLKRQIAEDILVDFIILNIIDIVFTEKTTFYKLHDDFDINKIDSTNQN